MRTPKVSANFLPLKISISTDARTKQSSDWQNIQKLYTIPCGRISFGGGVSSFGTTGQEDTTHAQKRWIRCIGSNSIEEIHVTWSSILRRVDQIRSGCTSEVRANQGKTEVIPNVVASESWISFQAATAISENGFNFQESQIPEINLTVLSDNNAKLWRTYQLTDNAQRRRCDRQRNLIRCPLNPHQE